MANVRNVKIKSVEIELDKKRNLLFDLNAFAELEEHYGNIDEAMTALEQGSMKALRAILWAGLIHEDESLTPRQVGSLLGLGDLEYLSKQIGGALGDSLPKEENGKKTKKAVKPKKVEQE